MSSQTVWKPAHKLREGRRTADVLNTEGADFASLLLTETVQQGLTLAGFERPSPIQLKAIPLGRCGLDLIVQAKSGTGKTCVFAVIALESLVLEAFSTQVLVLAPTREIAVQIHDVVVSIGQAMPGLKCHVFIGGLPVHEDKQKLKKCHIAIGSPGRIKQLVELGVLKTSSIRLFVLDEADKLLETGSFQEQINWIYSSLPVNKQMVALSATYPESLAHHLQVYMRDPTFVRLDVQDLSLKGIKQFYSAVPQLSPSYKAFQAKTDQLIKLLSRVPFHQCLVFSNDQGRAQNLCKDLNSKGWPTAYISGSQEQSQRLNAMSQLRNFQCRVLVSTDLTARGIDAEKVNLVVNLDVPHDWETYMHRIGRAGRFGTQGAAVTLVYSGKEEGRLETITRHCRLSLKPLPDPIPSTLITSRSMTSDEMMSSGDHVTVTTGFMIPTDSEEEDSLETATDSNVTLHETDHGTSVPDRTGIMSSSLTSRPESLQSAAGSILKTDHSTSMPDTTEITSLSSTKTCQPEGMDSLSVEEECCQSHQGLQNQSDQSLTDQSKQPLSNQSENLLNNQPENLLNNQSETIVHNQSETVVSNQPEKFLNYQPENKWNNQSESLLNNQSENLLTNQLEQRSNSFHRKVDHLSTSSSECSNSTHSRSTESLCLSDSVSQGSYSLDEGDAANSRKIDFDSSSSSLHEVFLQSSDLGEQKDAKMPSGNDVMRQSAMREVKIPSLASFKKHPKIRLTFRQATEDLEHFLAHGTEKYGSHNMEQLSTEQSRKETRYQSERTMHNGDIEHAEVSENGGVLGRERKRPIGSGRLRLLDELSNMSDHIEDILSSYGEETSAKVLLPDTVMSIPAESQNSDERAADKGTSEQTWLVWGRQGARPKGSKIRMEKARNLDNLSKHLDEGKQSEILSEAKYSRKEVDLIHENKGRYELGVRAVQKSRNLYTEKFSNATEHGEQRQRREGESTKPSRDGTLEQEEEETIEEEGEGLSDEERRDSEEEETDEECEEEDWSSETYTEEEYSGEDYDSYDDKSSYFSNEEYAYYQPDQTYTQYPGHNPPTYYEYEEYPSYEDGEGVDRNQNFSQLRYENGNWENRDPNVSAPRDEFYEQCSNAPWWNVPGRTAIGETWCCCGRRDCGRNRWLSTWARAYSQQCLYMAAMLGNRDHR